MPKKRYYNIWGVVIGSTVSVVSLGFLTLTFLYPMLPSREFLIAMSGTLGGGFLALTFDEGVLRARSEREADRRQGELISHNQELQHQLTLITKQDEQLIQHNQELIKQNEELESKVMQMLGPSLARFRTAFQLGAAFTAAVTLNLGSRRAAHQAFANRLVHNLELDDATVTVINVVYKNPPRVQQQLLDAKNKLSQSLRLRWSDVEQSAFQSGYGIQFLIASLSPDAASQNVKAYDDQDSFKQLARSVARDVCESLNRLSDPDSLSEVIRVAFEQSITGLDQTMYRDTILMLTTAVSLYMQNIGINIGPVSELVRCLHSVSATDSTFKEKVGGCIDSIEQASFRPVPEEPEV